MDEIALPQNEHAFLAGGGEMGKRIAAHDWAATSLGPIDAWPGSLKTATGLLVASPVPIVMLWGLDGIMIYNDAYSIFAGGRHPRLLGSNVREGWPEVANFNDNVMRVGLAGGTLSYRDQELTLHRNGRPEKVWMNLDYSPVPDESGRPAGVLAIVIETTERVRAERELRQERDRGRGVLDGMTEGFALLDRDFRVLDINAQGLSMETRPRDAIVGRVHWDLYPGSEASELGRLYKRALADNVPVSLEHRHEWKDDRSAWLEMRAYPVADGLAVFYRDVTDRKRAEAALAEGEERLRLATEAAEVGFWDVDAVNDILIWPARVKAMFGISADVPISMADFYAGLHPDDREAASAAFASAADPEWRALYDVEYRTIGKEDGLVRWVAAKGRGVFDDQARCVRVIGTAIDVTERRRAEEALRDSEARFRGFAQAVPNHLWTSPPNGMLDWFNDRVLEYSGVSAEVLQGGRWGSIVHPDDLPGAIDRWTAVLASGEVYEREFRIRRSDGAFRWHIARAFPVRDDAGRITRWVGTNTDIEDQKNAAAELERQVAERTAERDRLWTLSEDMLARAGYGGMMSAVSPAWTRVLGWTQAELLARPYGTFMHPDDMEPTLAALAQMGNTGRPTRFENRIATKDGAWKPIEWTVAPEPEEASFIAVGRDVSAVKAREAERSALEEQLRQSQKMEAVGQLTGGLAHDFNNLLAGISGSLELIGARLAQGRMADVDRYLLAAQGAAKRAAALTHRLLAFSRRQTLDPKPTNVNALVTGMEDLIRRTVGPSISVESIVGGGVWNVLVDPNQLENALLNLSINARDAMPDGGRITIETANRWLDERAAKERDLPPGQYVSMCVSDNGAGMSPDVVERAFDPFFTTKPIGVGTGLGLSMIYGFARQSGGQVRIYSEVGEGTMVCVYLPRHLGEATALAAEPDIAGASGAKSGETVLVIDDEPLVRMLVVDVLEDLGYRAIEAGDGPQGLKVLRSDARVDLLVTDVGLPNGMNGRQVADAARELRPGLKVLFVTGYAENAVLNHGHLDHGMHVVTKPFEMNELGRRIKALISES